MAASKIPVWIKQCLDQYGNCACGRTITKKIGKIFYRFLKTKDIHVNWKS